MRSIRRSLIVIVFLGLATSVSSQVPSVVHAEPQSVHVFPVGDNGAAFGYGGGGADAEGPRSLRFVGANTILVPDWVNGRFVWISSSGEYLGQTIEAPASWYVELDARTGTILTGSDQHVMVLERVGPYAYRFASRRSYRDFGLDWGAFIADPWSFTEGYVVGELSEAEDFVLLDISDPANPIKVSVAELRARQTPGEGLWVDDDGYLFLDDRLFTKNPMTFREYFGGNPAIAETYARGVGVPPFGASSGAFVGYDEPGYAYWDNYVFVNVLAPNGRRQTVIRLPETFTIDRSRIAVDPDGNLWFLKWSRDGHTLYRIENTWSPSE